MRVQQDPAQDTQPVGGGGLVLRLGPCVVYGGPGLPSTSVRVTSVLVWLQDTRVRLFNDARPTPECLLDLPVTAVDLDLTRLPRDRTVVVTVADGSQLRIVAQAGACACKGGSMLPGWSPS